MAGPPTPYTVSGADATTYAGPGFTTGNFRPGTAYGPVRAPNFPTAPHVPIAPQKIVVGPPSTSVKRALSVLPSVFGLFHG